MFSYSLPTTPRGHVHFENLTVVAFFYTASAFDAALAILFLLLLYVNLNV